MEITASSVFLPVPVIFNVKKHPSIRLSSQLLLHPTQTGIDVPPHTVTRACYAHGNRLSINRFVWHQNSVCVRTPTQFRAYATVYRPYLLLLPLYLLLICLLWWILQGNCYWNGFSA
jgi:hypothetical protein